MRCLTRVCPFRGSVYQDGHDAEYDDVDVVAERESVLNSHGAAAASRAIELRRRPQASCTRGHSWHQLWYSAAQRCVTREGAVTLTCGGMVDVLLLLQVNLVKFFGLLGSKRRWKDVSTVVSCCWVLLLSQGSARALSPTGQRCPS